MPRDRPLPYRWVGWWPVRLLRRFLAAYFYRLLLAPWMRHFTVEGAEHIPPGPVIYAATHTSMADTPLILRALGRHGGPRRRHRRAGFLLPPLPARIRPLRGAHFRGGADRSHRLPAPVAQRCNYVVTFRISPSSSIRKGRSPTVRRMKSDCIGASHCSRGESAARSYRCGSSARRNYCPPVSTGRAVQRCILLSCHQFYTVTTKTPRDS